MSADSMFSDLAEDFDWRDEAVLELFEEHDPDVVSLNDLRTAYRKVTDVRAGETLRERTRHLTKDGPFEYEGRQSWRYTG
jgi:hypothetical protein